MDELREVVVVPVYMDRGQCDMAVGSGPAVVGILLVVEEDTKLVEDDEEPCLVAVDICRLKRATSWAASRVSKNIPTIANEELTGWLAGG
jgi:hypothetical protein